MKENFFHYNKYIQPEYKKLHELKGMNLAQVIEYFEGEGALLLDHNKKFNSKLNNLTGNLKETEISIFDGFLYKLRNYGVRVSVPEWLHFLKVVENISSLAKLKELSKSKELLYKIRLYAMTTLVKDKTQEYLFHKAFDEYFGNLAQVIDFSLQKNENIKNLLEEINTSQEDLSEDINKKENKDENIDSEKPEIKEELGIKEVDENLQIEGNDEHDDNERVHGGKNDQHNDVLKKQDENKIGGGDKKDNPEYSENGLLIGGSKGNSSNVQLMNQGHDKYNFMMNDRQLNTEKFKPERKYEKRPDKRDIKEVIRNIRKIITDVSEVKSRNINIRSTVGNFARNSFRFEFNREREKQPEIVLFIDVGGPVDEWSPLIKQLSEEMTKGLTKLEIYLFHNNLFGYVWKPDSKNILKSSYAKPNSLINIKDIVKKRKKVIIYGDAEMSEYEFEDDGWPPEDNEDRVEKYGMSGKDCLFYIKRNSENCVWVNPVFKKEWQERDRSGTISEASDIIPMYDLTVGGIEDAIKKLMEK